MDKGYEGQGISGRSMYSFRPRGRAGRERQEIENEPEEENGGGVEVVRHVKEFVLNPERSVGLLQDFWQDSELWTHCVYLRFLNTLFFSTSGPLNMPVPLP